MTLAELRTRVRDYLDDYTTPQLYTNAQIDSALNEAQFEACIRSDLLSFTANITLLADISTYAMPANLLKIKSVLYKNNALEPVVLSGDFLLSIGNAPTEYAVNKQAGKIIFNSAVTDPTVDDFCTIRFTGTPVNLLVADASVPEISKHFHYPLCYRAVSTLSENQETDTRDLSRAVEYEAKFTTVFGVPISALAINQRANNTRVRARARFL